MPNIIQDKHLPEQTARQLLSRRKAMVEKLREFSTQHHKLLFDGDWLTEDQVRRRYRRLKWKHRKWFLELLILYFLLACTAGFVFLIFSMLLGL